MRHARWLAAVLLLAVGPARASDRMTELATKLATDKDFRARRPRRHSASCAAAERSASTGASRASSTPRSSKCW